MAEYLFDTDVLIDVLKGHRPTVEALAGLPDGAARSFSAVTEAELYAGLDESDGPEAGALARLLRAMEEVPVSGPVARLAGRYRRRYGGSHGTSLPDALIAASAQWRGAALVTRNRRHYPMGDIRVLEPRDLPES